MGKRSVNLLRKMAIPYDFSEAQTFSGAVTVSGLLKSTNTAGLRDARSFRDYGAAGAARTAITATALTVNTHYAGETATVLAMTIPSAAAGNIGDWITVFYTTDINDSTIHSYTTTTDTAYALGSTILRADGAVASVADVSVAADNVLTIDADTNGDGGIGTTLRFVNTTGALNGWAVECVVRGRGNKSTGKNAATVFS
jgi:hypothetical protein